MLTPAKVSCRSNPEDAPVFVLANAIDPPSDVAILCNSSRSPALIGANSRSLRSRVDLLVCVLDRYKCRSSISVALSDGNLCGCSISSALYECSPTTTRSRSWWSWSLRIFCVRTGANSRGELPDAIVVNGESEVQSERNWYGVDTRVSFHWR